MTAYSKSNHTDQRAFEQIIVDQLVGKFVLFVKNSKVHKLFHNNLYLKHIQNHLYALYNLAPFFKTHFNIILPL